MFALTEDSHLSKLIQQAQPLVKKIRFVAHLCNITSICKTGEVSSGSSSDSKEIKLYTTNNSLNTGENQEAMKGLTLLGKLLNQIIVTKERDCLLLLVYIFKNSCKPFFRYVPSCFFVVVFF